MINAIPSVTQPISYENGKLTNQWFTFLEKLFKITGGNYGITLGGNLDVNTTAVSNSGSSETDLITYSLPANALVNNGDVLEVKAWGVYASNGNNKTLKLNFGSQTILNTGAVAANSGSWEIKATIVRLSATTQEISATIISGNSTVADSATRTAGTQTLSSNLTIKCTGQGTSSNDITEYCQIIKLTPNI